VKEEQAVKMIQSVRHLKKHLGRLIVAEKISRVGIRKRLKRKENMGNGGYIKIITTTNRDQKTILSSESMDDVELEKEKLKHQDFSNTTYTKPNKPKL
jgi:hypothetical protein